jgi:hypothetical protein
VDVHDVDALATNESHELPERHQIKAALATEADHLDAAQLGCERVGLARDRKGRAVTRFDRRVCEIDRHALGTAETETVDNVQDVQAAQA